MSGWRGDCLRPWRSMPPRPYGTISFAATAYSLPCCPGGPGRRPAAVQSPLALVLSPAASVLRQRALRHPPRSDRRGVIVSLAARRFGDAQCVDSRIRELVEDDDPQLMFGLARHEPTNGRGLARSEAAGDDVRDRHKLFISKAFKAASLALDSCVPACPRSRTWQHTGEPRPTASF